MRIGYPFRRFSPAYESIRTKVFLAILLTQFYNCVEYELHPVYHPSAAEKESPELYSKNVRYEYGNSPSPVRWLQKVAAVLPVSKQLTLALSNAEWIHFFTDVVFEKIVHSETRRLQTHRQFVHRQT